MRMTTVISDLTALASNSFDVLSDKAFDASREAISALIDDAEILDAADALAALNYVTECVGGKDTEADALFAKVATFLETRRH